MTIQHAKWLEEAVKLAWRAPVHFTHRVVQEEARRTRDMD